MPARLRSQRNEKATLTFIRTAKASNTASEEHAPTVQAVEFLGQGQQYVVEGIHPKTIKPYRWLDNRSPATIGASNLTPITPVNIDHFFDSLKGLLDLHGYEVTRQSDGSSPRSTSKDVQLAPSLEAIKSALDAIENTVDYDTWITLSSAVKTAAGPERENGAFLIWSAWSMTYPGNTVKDIASKWASFHEPKADWRHLRNYAIQHGDGTFTDAPYDFDNVEPAPDAYIEEGSASLSPVAAMFDRYVWVESLALIADTKTGALLNREKFNVRNRHIGPPGKKEKCAYDILTANVSYLQTARSLTYRPGAGRFVDEDLPGLTGRCLNIWRPSSTALLETISEADIQPWLEHVVFVIPSETEREIVLDWLAWIFQNPGEKPNWALVIGSTAEGIGKDLMLEPIRTALGVHNVREIGPEELASDFSGFLLNARLLIIEEMQMHERKALMNRLKPIIAAPPYTLRVNIKHVPQYEVPNILAAVFFTNMENALAIGAHDRRYFVTWNDQKPLPAAYYTELVNWYQNGGAVAAASWLSKRDISSFDAKSKAPDSAAKTAMRLASRSLFDETLEDALANKNGPFRHSLFTLDEAVTYIENRTGDRPKVSPRKVAIALKKLSLTHFGRMTLGEPPMGSSAPDLKDSKEHQLYGSSNSQIENDNAAIRAACWAERINDAPMAVPF